MRRADQDRFASLAAEVVEPLRRYLARRTDTATAEDLLNETLLVCWRRLDDVPTDSPVPWAIGVARLNLANAQRSDRRRERLIHAIAAADPLSYIHHEPLDDRASVQVASALTMLSDNDAEVLRLWAWEQLGPAEIARSLDISVNAAAVRLHRAKNRLRTHLIKLR